MKVVPLRYDVAFKKAFGQVDVFNAFVRDILGIEFEVDEVHREFSYHEQVGRVKLKYDLFAEDIERRIIVELQHVREADFFDRFLYYHLIGLIEQIQSYQDYRFGKTVYTIVLLTSVPKDQSKPFGMLNVSFDARDEYQEAHDLYPHRLIFLNPHQLNDAIPPATRQWLDAVIDSLDGEANPDDYDNIHINKALHAVQEQELTPEEMALAKDEAAWQRSKRESRDEGRQEGEKIGLQKGKEIGLQKGEEIGLQKGEEIGLQKGEEIGLQKGLYLAAKRLLTRGQTPAEVSTILGLDIQLIEQINAEINAENTPTKTH